MSVDLAAAAREALASQNDQIARFEVWKYNKIKPKKKRTVAVDMRQKLLYCLDKRELRKPILPLKKLVTVHDDFADSPLLVLEFEKGIKKYKFEFLELAEKNRFWVILQRFCSKPSAGPASQGVGDSGSPSAGARGRRASISDRLFRRRSAGPSTTMSAQAITKTRRELETCVASFLVTKFTRFGDRQRLFALDVDRSHLKSIDPTTGSVTKEFELKNITEITRVASNDRRLRLKFDWATQRDYLVQFETCNARESFCALLAVMHRPVLSMDEGEVDLSDFAVAYDVQVVTSTGLRRKRTLLLDRAHRAVYRVSNVGDATDLVVAGLEPIEPPGGDADGSASNAPPTQAKKTKNKKKKPKKKLPKFESRRVNQYTSIVAHAVDRRRIKLLFGRPPTGGKALGVGNWDGSDLVFTSIDQCERFCGQVRAFSEEAAADAESSEADEIIRNGVDTFCTTWNVSEGKPPPPEEIARWLPLGFHMYAIAMQECSHRADYLKAIEKHLGPGMVTIHQVYLWAINMTIIVRKCLVPRITNIQTAHEACGLGNVLGNKGGCAIGFTLQNDTRICFASSHFAARFTRLGLRGKNYRQIVRKLRLGQRKQREFLHHYHHVFWLGDFNYRVNLGKHGTPAEFEYVVAKSLAGDVAELVANDQLVQERSAGRVFYGFQEGVVNWPPTYRMLKGEPGYSNKRNQNPSYTDRILWRSHDGFQSHVGCSRYSGQLDVMTSDHRPVMAQFTVLCRPSYCISPPFRLLAAPGPAVEVGNLPAAARKHIEGMADGDAGSKPKGPSKALVGRARKKPPRMSLPHVSRGLTTVDGGIRSVAHNCAHRCLRIAFEYLFFEAEGATWDLLREGAVAGGDAKAHNTERSASAAVATAVEAVGVVGDTAGGDDDAEAEAGSANGGSEAADGENGDDALDVVPGGGIVAIAEGDEDDSDDGEDEAKVAPAGDGTSTAGGASVAEQSTTTAALVSDDSDSEGDDEADADHNSSSDDDDDDGDGGSRVTASEAGVDDGASAVTSEAPSGAAAGDAADGGGASDSEVGVGAEAGKKKKAKKAKKNKKKDKKPKVIKPDVIQATDWAGAQLSVELASDVVATIVSTDASAVRVPSELEGVLASLPSHPATPAPTNRHSGTFIPPSPGGGDGGDAGGFAPDTTPAADADSQGGAVGDDGGASDTGAAPTTAAASDAAPSGDGDGGVAGAAGGAGAGVGAGAGSSVDAGEAAPGNGATGSANGSGTGSGSCSRPSVRPCECYWEARQIPTLKPFIVDRQHVLFQTVNITVKRGQKPVGQCELSLMSLTPLKDNPTVRPASKRREGIIADENGGPACDSVYTGQFNVPVVLHGSRAGYISGRVLVYALDRLATAERRIANFTRFRAASSSSRRTSRRMSLSGMFSRSQSPVAESSTARFPGASKAMGEIIHIPRRVVRLWAKDVRATLPHLTQAQLVFVLHQRGEVVDDPGELDRDVLLAQADHALRTGPKAMVCDFAPEDDGAHISEVLMGAYHHGQATDGQDSNVDVIRWMGSDMLADIPDKYSSLVMSMVDRHVGLAAKAEPYATTPHSKVPRIMGDKLLEYIQQSRGAIDATTEAEAKAVVTELLKLGVLQVVFDDGVHCQPCDTKARSQAQAPQHAAVPAEKGAAQPASANGATPAGAGGAAGAGAAADGSATALPGPRRRHTMALDVDAFDFHGSGFIISAAVATHPFYAVGDELDDEDDDEDDTIEGGGPTTAAVDDAGSHTSEGAADGGANGATAASSDNSSVQA